MDSKNKLMQDLGFRGAWNQAFQSMYQGAVVIINDEEIARQESVEHLKDLVYSRLANAAYTLVNELPQLKEKIMRGERLTLESKYTDDDEDLENPELIKGM